SSNSAVFASTNISFAKGVTSQTVNLPILAVGDSLVTASGTGVGTVTFDVSGLDESGLVNDWLGDTYTNNSTSWIDSTSGVVATGTGVEIAVPLAFGTHTGVARNATGATG